MLAALAKSVGQPKSVGRENFSVVGGGESLKKSGIPGVMRFFVAK